jgi:leader peptidase (prepilin peptidase)/N-methyltransferase
VEHAAKLGGALMILAPSSQRQLLAAIGGGLFGAVAAWAIAQPSFAAGQVLASAVLCAAMTAIALEDSLRFRVPDPWVYGATITGALWSYLARVRSGDSTVAASVTVVVSVIICGGVFLLVREVFYRLRGVDGLGLGDVKLAAAGGAWLEFTGFPYALFVAAAGALAFIATRKLRGGKWTTAKRLPFGAFLAPAIWATWLVLNG